MTKEKLIKFSKLPALPTINNCIFDMITYNHNGFDIEMINDFCTTFQSIIGHRAKK